MKKIILSPSLMCADFTNLSSEIESLEYADIDMFHVDIMDGKFVPNFALGVQDLKAISKITQKKLDVHLMIEDPGKYISLFADLGADIIYIHPESDCHIVRTLYEIKDKNINAGIAINPGTSFESIKVLLEIVDYVLVMTVNPGFSGQKYLKFVNNKLIEIINYRKNNNKNYKIMVDGAISENEIISLSKIGVDGFILGTSALFNKNEEYKVIIKRIRNYLTYYDVN